MRSHSLAKELDLRVNYPHLEPSRKLRLGTRENIDGITGVPRNYISGGFDPARHQQWLQNQERDQEIFGLKK